MRQGDINYQDAFKNEPAQQDGQIISGPAPSQADGSGEVPYISNWQTNILQFKDDWMTSSTRNVIDSWRIKTQQEDKTSPIASKEDIDSAKEAVQGLSVPEGARESTLKSLKEEQADKNNTEFLLGLSKPGFLNRSEQAVGHLITSTITNPVSIAAGALAGAAVSTLIPEVDIPILATEGGSIATSLGKYLLRTSTIGATDFSMYQLSNEASSEMYSKATGSDYSEFNGLLNIAKSGVIGASLLGIPSTLLQGLKPEVRELLSTEMKAFGGRQAEDAAQSALNQVIKNGKDPGSASHLSYRYGMAQSADKFKQRMSVLNVTKEDANEGLDQVISGLNEQHKPIEDEIQRQKNLLKDHKLSIPDLEEAKSKIESLSPVIENSLEQSDINSLKKQQLDLKQKRKAIKRSFDDRMALLKKQKPKMKFQDRRALVTKGVNKDVEPFEENLSRIKSQLDNNDLAQRAKADITRIEQKVRPFLNASAKEKGTSIADYLKKRNELENSDMTFNQLKGTHASFDHFVNTDEAEMPNEPYNQFIREQQEPKSDFQDTGGLDETEQTGRDFENAENLLNDTYPEETKKNILPDEDVLSPEEKKDFENVKESPNRIKKFGDSVKNLMDCILENI